MLHNKHSNSSSKSKRGGIGEAVRRGEEEEEEKEGKTERWKERDKQGLCTERTVGSG